ncbi:MAG TPA: hypothetical protein VGM80_02515 [Gaiellaceae bacterium]|jgi:hypothetical protein
MAGEEVADPGEALVEQRVARGQVDDIYEKRVTTGGDVLEKSATDAHFDGTNWHFVPQTLVWRRVGQLDSGELESVRAAIGSSGFMAVSADHRPSATSIGGSDVTWTANLDGESHSVTLHGVPDVKVAEVDALAAAFERAIASALDRASRG